MSPNWYGLVVLVVLEATQPTQVASSEIIDNGSWSEWGAWSTCSLTCGSGVTIRFRRCDSPAPSSNGTDCTGDPMEVDSCHVTLCPGKQSAFTATIPDSLHSNLAFTNVITNIGDDYSSLTGKFTCQYPGIYFFAVSITKIRSGMEAINDRAFASIVVNGNAKVHARTDPQDDSDIGSYETSATLVTRLSAGDYVYITGTDSDTMNRNSHFSGFLILPD